MSIINKLSSTAICVLIGGLPSMVWAEDCPCDGGTAHYSVDCSGDGIPDACSEDECGEDSCAETGIASTPGYGCCGEVEYNLSTHCCVDEEVVPRSTMMITPCDPTPPTPGSYQGESLVVSHQWQEAWIGAPPGTLVECRRIVHRINGETYNTLYYHRFNQSHSVSSSSCGFGLNPYVVQSSQKTVNVSACFRSIICLNVSITTIVNQMTIFDTEGISERMQYGKAWTDERSFRSAMLNAIHEKKPICHQHWAFVEEIEGEVFTSMEDDWMDNGLARNSCTVKCCGANS